MATVVNIGNGIGKSGPSRNSPANSTRAQNAQNLVNGPTAVSSDGSVAVSTGKMGQSKFGSIVDGALDIASQMPGVVGTIGRLGTKIKGLFTKNDPEWWQSVPGDGITTNAPLREVSLGSIYNAQEGKLAYPAAQLRPMLGVFNSGMNYYAATDPSIDNYRPALFMNVTDQQVTQYLMPEIRKVVNAIPLQDAGSYAGTLANSAAIYALWRNLRKYDYLVKHGQTYLASMNDPAFPVLQVKNAAWLQSTIGRLEELLRASVRIPHTLCEYLAWRYGRIYKANNNAKAALILHNVISITAPISQYDKLINAMTTYQSSSAALQQANTDLYNAYFDHDMTVEISDYDMFAYDQKEWLLRTNLDLTVSGGKISKEFTTDVNPIIIDSALDNPTTFMASTVSTMGRSPEGAQSVLFPTGVCQVFTPYDKVPAMPAGHYVYFSAGGTVTAVELDTHLAQGSSDVSAYYVANIFATYSDPTKTADLKSALKPVVAAMYAKALDIYNTQQYLVIGDKSVTSSNDISGANPRILDITTISSDLGLVDDLVVGNEQVYAFANLVSISRKVGKSARAIVTPMAKAVADVVASPAVGIVK